MPHLTECQLATDILLDAFITQVITESNDCLNSQIAFLIESDSGTEYKIDKWDESLPPLSSVFLQVVLMLYSSHYLNECITIPKSSPLLWILLNVHKEKHKAIFQSYLCIWP